MGKIVRVLDKFMTEFEKDVVAFGIILLSVVVIMNILTRSLFKFSWIGTEEFSQFCVIWVTFMGTSLGARGDIHISMNAFVDMIPPRVRDNIYIVVGFISALFCFWMTYLGSQYTLLSVGGGQVSPALMVPVWPFYVPLPLGMFLAGIQYIRRSVKRIGGIREPLIVQETPKIE